MELFVSHSHFNNLSCLAELIQNLLSDNRDVILINLNIMTIIYLLTLNNKVLFIKWMKNVLAEAKLATPSYWSSIESFCIIFLGEGGIEIQ